MWDLKEQLKLPLLSIYSHVNLHLALPQRLLFVNSHGHSWSYIVLLSNLNPQWLV